MSDGLSKWDWMEDTFEPIEVLNKHLDAIDERQKEHDTQLHLDFKEQKKVWCHGVEYLVTEDASHVLSFAEVADAADAPVKPEGWVSYKFKYTADLLAYSTYIVKGVTNAEI